MDEKERKKLVQQRKREQKQKSFTNDIAKHLQWADQQNEVKSAKNKNYNKIVEALLILAGTTIPLYGFIFCPIFILNFIYGDDLRVVGIDLEILLQLLHLLIWGIALVSIYKRKSLIDTFFDHFS